MEINTQEKRGSRPIFTVSQKSVNILSEFFFFLSRNKRKWDLNQNLNILQQEQAPEPPRGSRLRHSCHKKTVYAISESVPAGSNKKPLAWWHPSLATTSQSWQIGPTNYMPKAYHRNFYDICHLSCHCLLSEDPRSVKNDQNKQNNLSIFGRLSTECFNRKATQYCV